MMEYIHVKNLDKYQPGYTDRRHIWAKIYYETFLDETVQGLSEIDRYRFWSLIVFEVYTQKPVPLTDTNLKIMGWNKSKRRISLSLQMLHTLIDVRNTETKPTVTQSRVEESRVEEKNIYMEFVKLTNDEHSKLVKKFGSKETEQRIAALNDYIGSKGKKYHFHYHTILNWARKDEKNASKTGRSIEERDETYIR